MTGGISITAVGVGAGMATMGGEITAVGNANIQISISKSSGSETKGDSGAESGENKTFPANPDDFKLEGLEEKS